MLLGSQALSSVRNEVVDVRQVGGTRYDADGTEAVEAAALLVAVQRVACGRHGHTAPSQVGTEVNPVGIVADQRHCHAKFPSRLDEPPSSLDLLSEITGLTIGSEPPELVGQPDPLALPSFIDEEPDAEIPTDVVERVDDVVEAEAHSHVTERLIVNHTVVPGGAGVEELPRGGRDLFRRALQVTADGLGVGEREIIETDQVTGSGPSAEQSFPQRELERSCVPSEQDDRSPSVLGRGLDVEKTVHFGENLQGALLTELGDIWFMRAWRSNYPITNRCAPSSLSDLTKNGSETEITMRFLSYN